MIPFIDAIRLNQYAQDIRPRAEAKAWFSQMSGEQKRNVLYELAAMIQQTHPLPDELPQAITRAGLKATHTPSQLMSRGAISVQAAKVIALPEQEHEKAFLLFVSLLGIADARRRNTQCAQGCNHWWHKDLSNEVLVRRLVNEYGREAATERREPNRD